MKKESIYSLLRHALTALAGLGGYLAAHGWIAAGDAPNLDAAGAAAADATATVAAALLARLLLLLAGKLKGGSGTAMLVVCTALAAVLLPSCSAISSKDAVPPVRACVETKYGRICYDSGK